ncbi:hypothetical protein IE81DRAFT_311554 [Ceraceosorus guamensis]|uniref:Polynucleotide 5'-hydroxyl-kinase GRC3 n=1 Tax=Ceraceosorus guamensis TaxID=1522189 RepID=A0A316W1Z4_9BASI|nr:hypothetical protein IE81DRAFT_311554 [Ceraceosorus guamensis]PWN43810.1 hypothetical protein IE81DRAFT_311554 [Ceraceosorus guamensis]
MTIRRVTLPPRGEYRFELENEEKLSIRLVPSTGDAEIFGSSLISSTSSDRWYNFGEEAKAAICSWSGCELELAGSASVEYLADSLSPTFGAYTNLHLYLEQERLKARNELRSASRETLEDIKDRALRAANPTVPLEVDSKDDTGVAELLTGGEKSGQAIYENIGQGPRVLVVGPESAGKTSLANLLANYALKSPAVCEIPHMKAQEDNENKRDGEAESALTGWWPVIANLDPSAGAPTLPCTFSLLPLSPSPSVSLTTASPAYPFGLTLPTTGLFTTTSLNPVSSIPAQTLWLGKEDVRTNEVHSKRVVDWLGAALERRLARDYRARCSGVIVDSMGVNSKDARKGYSFLKHVVRTLYIDTIIVLGHEKLHIELTRLFASATPGGEASAASSASSSTHKPIQVIKLPKSGGVVELDETYKARLRSLQIRNYFYGGSVDKKSTSAKTGADHVASSLAPAVVDDRMQEATNNEGGPTDGTPLGGLPPLNPLTTSIPFDLLEIYRVGQESMAPTSALPIGMGRTVTETQLLKLDIVNSLADQNSILHNVLALVEPPHGGGGPGQPDSQTVPPPEDDAIIGANVLGFLHVVGIDTQRKKLNILSPNPTKRLPSKTALLGTLDWQDA